VSNNLVGEGTSSAGSVVSTRKQGGESQQQSLLLTPIYDVSMSTQQDTTIQKRIFLFAK
jgi:hypothetical protein